MVTQVEGPGSGDQRDERGAILRLEEGSANEVDPPHVRQSGAGQHGPHDGEAACEAIRAAFIQAVTSAETTAMAAVQDGDALVPSPCPTRRRPPLDRRDFSA
ncbi:MAG: hypothetical protein ACXVHI_00365 [Frankiaceae bacterium]